MWSAQSQPFHAAARTGSLASVSTTLKVGSGGFAGEMADVALFVNRVLDAPTIRRHAWLPGKASHPDFRFLLPVL